ncbi:hypothetical protein AIOGIFDO_00687 [Candidatus Methanoperedenaceae archaeon GB37]|nr:hypothetical protein AIOGIFDO_00687 [Candidatus Methanoperedenaceae archaeon GB37]
MEEDPLNLQKSRRKNYREMLKEEEWTTKEVQEVIEAELEFGVVYSSWQVRRILKSFGMRYAKPYQKDYRKPDNAEDTLKKSLDEAGISDDVIGFVDKMAVEANANTTRLWSFNKPLKRVATHVKSKVVGLYCINGEKA